MRRIGRLVVPLVIALAACGSSTKPSSVATAPPVTSTTSLSPSSPATTQPSSTSTVGNTTTAQAPKNPATADLTFVGDPGLAGPASKPVVSCNSPTIDGTVVLRVLAQPANPPVLFSITLSAGRIAVLAGSGSGDSFTYRTFEGHGVTKFDASTGAMIDTPLTETTPASAKRGAVGAITSASGSVSCGDQTVGTSTITYSGQTLEGAVNGAPDPFRVECNVSSQGNFVSFVGIIAVGGTKALVFTNFTQDEINTFESIAGPPLVQHQYTVKAPGVSTLTGTGAHVVGDIVEQPVKGGESHTLHVEGDVTCGATVDR